MRLRTAISGLGVVLAFTLTAMPARAGYPERPISYLVAFSAGGESDITARLQQKYLEEILGQKIVISYKTGGGGSVAWAELVRSEPNGYTTAGINEPHTVLQPLQRADTGYKTEDLVRIGCFQYTPVALIVKKDSPFKTLGDFIGYAKSHPEIVTVGGTGTWASTHFTYLLLQKAAGVKLTYVPYQGSGATKPALLGGHVSALFAHPTMAVQIKDEVRVLAIASEERSRALPDVPTFKELGYAGIVEGSYRGIAAPPGTSKEVVTKLASAFKKVNDTPAYRQKMEELGFDLLWWGPDEYTQRIQKMKSHYASLLQEYGYKK